MPVRLTSLWPFNPLSCEKQLWSWSRSQEKLFVPLSPGHQVPHVSPRLSMSFLCPVSSHLDNSKRSLGLHISLLG